MALRWEQVKDKDGDSTTGLKWVSSEISWTVPDGPIIRLLEKKMEQYRKEAWERLLEPSFFLGKLKKRRYMERSKPCPHEFGEADGRAVMRRLRHGKPVSPALITRAVKAITDAATDDYW